jgi:hypothetical protein
MNAIREYAGTLGTNITLNRTGATVACERGDDTLTIRVEGDDAFVAELKRKGSGFRPEHVLQASTITKDEMMTKVIRYFNA